jgi:hypothetical protein
MLANGLFKGYFEFVGKETIAIEHSYLPGEEHVDLVMYIPTTGSPHDAEASNDMRCLGIALAGLTVVTQRIATFA